MYEQIASNRAKTVFIIIGFIIFITAIGFAVGYYIDYRYGINSNYSILLMVFALILAIIMSFSSYYYSDKIVLGLTRARPISREENPQSLLYGRRAFNSCGTANAQNIYNRG